VFENCVLKTSGQWWKAIFSFICVVGSGAAMLYGLSQLGDSTAQSSLPLLFGGMVLGMFGFVFACTAIRCSLCGARWVWLGVKGQSPNQWLGWLLSQSECPVCKSARGSHVT